MIEVKNLVKVYASGTKAIDGLDLSVADGEIFALLGPNGAGKSTTIRVLATLSGFDSGSVSVANHNVDKAPEKVRAAIGLVAQQTGIDFFLTGRENLSLHGHLYHLPSKEIARRIDELAHYFELGDALDRQVATYSGGMRRKLDIATALIHRPQLVFLDEPTLGLDIHSRKNLWRYIRQLNKELGLTILLTTHYLEEADSLADRVAIINRGKISAIDTPENLKASIGGDVVTLSLAEQNANNAVLAQRLETDGLIKGSLWEGSRLHVYVDHGASSIAKIAQIAAELAVDINELSLRRPSLDDVFIRHTGTSIGSSEDAGEEPWWKQWAGQGGGGKWQKKWQNAEADESGAVTDEPQADESSAWPDAATSDTAGQWNKDSTPSAGNGGQDWQRWQPPKTDAPAAQQDVPESPGQQQHWNNWSETQKGHAAGDETEWQKWQKPNKSDRND